MQISISNIIGSTSNSTGLLTESYLVYDCVSGNELNTKPYPIETFQPNNRVISYGIGGFYGYVINPITSVSETLEISSTPIIASLSCSDSDLILTVVQEQSGDTLFFRLLASNSNGTFATKVSPFNFDIDADISYTIGGESSSVLVRLNFSTNEQEIVSGDQVIESIPFDFGAIPDSYSATYAYSNLGFPVSSTPGFQQVNLYSTDGCYLDRGINTVTGVAYSITYSGTGNC